jgi:hypothetical protein
VAFVDSTASVFFMAAQSGAFRSIVPRAQLPAAASVAQGRAATVRLAGPPLGGALFAVGRAVPFLVDAVSYAFSTLWVGSRFNDCSLLESRLRDPLAT